MASYADLLGPARAAPGVRHAATSTPASLPLKGRETEMKLNAAGGMVFKLDPWSTLRRFLVLGTTTNTYYASAEKLSADALVLIDALLELDAKQVVDTIVEVSVSGAPLKQSPCIFALARACSKMTGDAARDTNQQDPVTVGRAYALQEAPKVLRTYQHVFEFLDYARRQRGGGRGLTRMLKRVQLTPAVDQVEYQTLKYRNRVGWTPRDLLRYSHPKPDVTERGRLFGWTTKPESDAGREAVATSQRLAAFEELQRTTDPTRAAKLIADHKLTHEFVPNALLNEKVVWEALLPNLPLTALTRNLRKMTQVGLLTDGSAATKIVREKLTNVEALRRARLHPLRIMGALGAYGSGTSRYGHGSEFIPAGAVLAILNDALELSYSAVTPLGKRVVVAIDKSGSMSQASPMQGLNTFHACLALAAYYKRTEEQCSILLFDTTATLLNVSNKITFSELQRISNPAGGTSLAAPIEWLLKNHLNVDPEVVITMTDNETWHGAHYVEAVGRLRLKAKHKIASAVVAVTATDCSVSDPKDPHAMDVVGFDPTVAEAVGAHVREVFAA